MRRREFIALFGGAFAAWAPLKAHAQQRVGPRRLDVVLAVGKTPEYVAAVAAFEQQLASLGWRGGENLRIEYHWSAGSQEAALSAAKQI
jgi:putative tryptophan/tyrosine transport system substrate-binding protein